jgi:catechol 2,3-dioxygenase-like lactoylglutathione lyase family enzyme
MPTDTVATAVRFSIGLCTPDLTRAVQFYRVLFGIEPVKHCEENARFDLDSPSLTLSLYTSDKPAGGALNHLGLRLPDASMLIEVQRRLEEHGIATQRQDGVECCYSRQTKFWVTDPDRVLWEIYTLEEDTDHSGFDDAPATATPVAQHVWEHRLTDAWPDKFEQTDGSLDEVRLEGTFNARVTPKLIEKFLSEVRRVLRPGGRVTARALVGDRPFPGTPQLPGPASAVQRVPLETELFDALRQAGFGGLFMDSFEAIHCFEVEGVELHDARIVGFKAAGSSWPRVEVIYKGPFEHVTDDDGTRYCRGEQVMVGWAQADRLRTGPAADQFTMVGA